MAECDDIRTQIARDLVHRASAIAAAEVATVIRLVFEQTQRGIIAKVSPSDAPLPQVVTERLDGPEKLPLFHGERANREFDGSSLGEQQQGFEERERILTA